MYDCKHVSLAVRDQDQDQMSVRYLRTEESLQMGTVDRDFNTVGIIFLCLKSAKGLAVSSSKTKRDQ